jgi:hypothetical protein
LLRFCCQPEARFYFLLVPLSRGEKNPMTLVLQDVIGLSH